MRYFLRSLGVLLAKLLLAVCVIAALLAVLAPLTYAQRENTLYVIQFDGATQGEKTTNAQKACNANHAMTCVLVFDPTLAAYRLGTMPVRNSWETWLDYRVPGTIGGGTTALASGPPITQYVINDGSAGTSVGPLLPATFAGAYTKGRIVVKHAHATTDLTFTITKNGVPIFTATVPHATAAGTLVSSTFASVAVAPNDVFGLDVASGDPAWQFTVVLN